jgi:hypothetical protein
VKLTGFSGKRRGNVSKVKLVNLVGKARTRTLKTRTGASVNLRGVNIIEET